MKLNHRVRSLKSILKLAGSSQQLVCAITNPGDFETQIKKLGLAWPLVAGQSVLPKRSWGSAAEENSEGWIEVHDDQPMETYYQTRIWRWKMKRGYDFEWDEKLVDVPHKRYPRTEHPPHGLEIRVTPKTDGSMILTLPEIPIKRKRRLRTGINMLVEIFGECTVLHENLDELIKAKIQHLNWRVLPPGKLPWDKMQKEVQKVISKEPASIQQMIEARLKVVNGFGPEFVAVGTHGFHGYLVFGFPAKKIHLLESLYLGNATYGLGKNWETLSKLSKGELLNQDLHEFRIIHNADWKHEIKKQMK